MCVPATFTQIVRWRQWLPRRWPFWAFHPASSVLSVLLWCVLEPRAFLLTPRFICLFFRVFKRDFQLLVRRMTGSLEPHLVCPAVYFPVKEARNLDEIANLLSWQQPNTTAAVVDWWSMHFLFLMISVHSFWLSFNNHAWGQALNREVGDSISYTNHLCGFLPDFVFPEGKYWRSKSSPRLTQFDRCGFFLWLRVRWVLRKLFRYFCCSVGVSLQSLIHHPLKLDLEGTSFYGMDLLDLQTFLHLLWSVKHKQVSPGHS